MVATTPNGIVIIDSQKRDPIGLNIFQKAIPALTQSSVPASLM